MIEEVTRIWVNMNEKGHIDWPNNMNQKLELNLYIDNNTSNEDLIVYIQEIHKNKYGFSREYPSIILHSPYQEIKRIIDVIDKFDYTVPRISVNVIIYSGECESKEVINELIVCYNILKMHYTKHSYSFIINRESCDDVKNTIFIRNCFNTYLSDNTDDVRPYVYVDIFPFDSISTNFAKELNQLFEAIDGDYVSPTCGLISILYYSEIISILRNTYQSVDVNKYILPMNQFTRCLYKDDAKCSECLISASRHVFCGLKKLRDKANSVLFQMADLEEIKILDADWDYIV